MTEPVAAYGLWPVAFIKPEIFSFFKPQASCDWRSFAAFSAFVVALFTEMNGFPWTIFRLSGWLRSTSPDTEKFADNSGRLLELMFGWQSNPHFDPFHILIFALIAGGFLLKYVVWHHLWSAQKQRRLATTGLCARIRHPQHLGFILILLGLLVLWPMNLALAMFPVGVWTYARFARVEITGSREWIGGIRDRYAIRIPAFANNNSAKRSDDHQHV